MVFLTKNKGSYYEPYLPFEIIFRCGVFVVRVAREKSGVWRGDRRLSIQKSSESPMAASIQA
jgi:hypothetical protein